jgi:acyl carrier protein
MTIEVYKEVALKKVKQVISKFFEVPVEELTPATDLFKDLHFSAMQFVELTVQLEMDFDRKIFDNNAMRLTTIRQLVDHIARTMAGGKA